MRINSLRLFWGGVSCLLRSVVPRPPVISRKNILKIGQVQLAIIVFRFQTLIKNRLLLLHIQVFILDNCSFGDLLPYLFQNHFFPCLLHFSGEASEDSAIGDSGTARGSSSLSPPPLSPEPSPSPSLSAEPQAPSSAVLEEDDESLGLDPRLLSRRERSEAERRVEALARELVSRDKSLTPLLDSWAGRSSMDVMEEIFPAYGRRSSWQRRRSSVSPEDR